LDSLVRIETYQWVTRIFRAKKIRAAFSSAKRRDGRQDSWAFREGRIAHAPSLTSFLFFCNKLPSSVFFFRGPVQRHSFYGVSVGAFSETVKDWSKQASVTKGDPCRSRRI
jgi:hypothetical protein